MTWHFLKETQVVVPKSMQWLLHFHPRRGLQPAATARSPTTSSSSSSSGRPRASSRLVAIQSPSANAGSAAFSEHSTSVPKRAVQVTDSNTDNTCWQSSQDGRVQTRPPVVTAARQGDGGWHGKRTQAIVEVGHEAAPSPSTSTIQPVGLVAGGRRLLRRQLESGGVGDEHHAFRSLGGRSQRRRPDRECGPSVPGWVVVEQRRVHLDT